MCVCGGVCMCEYSYIVFASYVHIEKEKKVLKKE